MTKIVILDGHPDPDLRHYIHALAQAYAEGAEHGGHPQRRVAIGELDFSIIRDPDDYQHKPPPPEIAKAQDYVRWADHLVILYPLWQGMMPAYLKAFFEQIARPGFAMDYGEGGMPKPLLTGKSARIIVTMGMPAIFYRWVYRAHSLKALERSILGFAGIGPINHTVIGSVDADADHRQRWLERVRRLGKEAG